MTMQKNILIRWVPGFRLRAFTLLESLLTLFVVSFLVLNLSGSVQEVFQDVEEQIFFLSFEHLYRDSQRLSAARQEQVTLRLSQQVLTNGFDSLALPQSIQLAEEKSLVFNQNGGNSSLTKVQFETKKGRITYQLYLGSGKYQKSTT